MATWNTLFEQIPRNGNNPGFGADAIRDLKSAITERDNLEHIWGQAETDTGEPGGRHREGSSRGAVTDDASLPTERVETRVASTTGQIGQVTYDMSIVNPVRTQDGDSLVTINGDYEDQYTQDIKVVIPELTSGGTWDHNNTQVKTIFSAQDFMDLISDQSVNGVKVFILSPEVPDVGVRSTTVDGAHKYDVADADKATSASEIYDAVDNGKYFNIFDPNDLDNATVVVGDYVQRDIKCREVDAESLKGVVWTA